MAAKAICDDSECEASVGYPERACLVANGTIGTCVLIHEGSGSVTDRVSYEAVAVVDESMNGDEQKTGPYLSRVGGDAEDWYVRAARARLGEAGRQLAKSLVPGNVIHLSVAGRRLGRSRAA